MLGCQCETNKHCLTVCACRHAAGYDGRDGCPGHHRVLQSEAAGPTERLRGGRDDPPCRQHHQVCTAAEGIQQTRPLVAKHVSELFYVTSYSCYLYGFRVSTFFKITLSYVWSNIWGSRDF